MSVRARLLLLILFATLTPVIVVGVNFLEYRDPEIGDARRHLFARSTNLPFESAVLALMDGKGTMCWKLFGG